jgi:ribose 5-phosphate isomerase A
MSDELKRQVGRELASRVQDGECIGVGTGTTVDAALVAIGERVRAEGLQISVVPTSFQSAWRAEEFGLRVLSPLAVSEISWGFDGADEIDEQLRLIKGGGGALLHEKIMAVHCKKYVVIAHESKLVDTLGAGFAIPVEVIPEAQKHVVREIKKLGAESVVLRAAKAKGGPVVTEAGNVIIDAKFSSVGDGLEAQLNTIVGVVENGIFSGIADEALIAGETGIVAKTG